MRMKVEGGKKKRVGKGLFGVLSFYDGSFFFCIYMKFDLLETLWWRIRLTMM